LPEQANATAILFAPRLSAHYGKFVAYFRVSRRTYRMRAKAGATAGSPRQQLGGTLAFANQLVESIVFLRVEPDHVFLDGNLFPGHESPPSLPCRDRDSEILVMINDGSD
jgi:hypothetical protein